MQADKFLWHCGWCQPLSKWQQSLYQFGVRWTTGICAECFEREKQALHAKRTAPAERPTLLATG